MSDELIRLDHGSGGDLSRKLVEEIITPSLANPLLDPLDDGAVFDPTGLLNRVGPGGALAMTTDSYVVTPIFFPGGDIGSLAIHGTVNDLAMCGAIPAYLTCGLILEEGLPLADLERIVKSLARAAREAGVQIVSGDTKVVDKGSADKVFINTAGVGVVPAGVKVSAGNARPGDAVILSGTMADHGLTIMAQREGLGLTTNLLSDSAPLGGMVQNLIRACPEIRVLRDPTRGGVGTALNEIARSSGVEILLDEAAIPIRDEVRAGCELLGLDPLYLANEGKLLAIVPENKAEQGLAAIRADKYGREVAIIGRVGADNPGRVVLETPIGTTRIIGVLSGDQLPRIC